MKIRGIALFRAPQHPWQRLLRALLAGVFGALTVVYWPTGCATNPPPATPEAAPTPAELSPAPARGLLPHPAFAHANAREPGVSIADIAERATRSVVSISSERAREAGPVFPFPFFRPGPSGPEREHGLGSGVIVSETGVVLTNNHLIEGADEIRVTTSDGREFDADVKGADDRSDLAVLQLKGELGGLVPLEFGDSSRLRLGDIVLAIGNPFGIGQTVTMGIVSAKGRADIGIVDYEDFIQTDAAINPGNSGGALVDMEGKLVGINTAILSRSGGYQGIGFAIPTLMAKPIMDSLLHNGRVERGFLGVGIQDIDRDLAEAMKLGNAGGVLIAGVQPGGAAEKAGLKRGDVVVSVDGTPVDSTGRLRNLVAATGAGKELSLKVLREGKTLTFKVTLGTLPEDESALREKAPESSAGVLGLELRDLNPELAARFGIERNGGAALVAQVARGSAAATAGIRPGDLVLEVNRTKVATAAAAKDAIQGSKGTLLLLIERRGQARYVAVRR